MKKVGDEVVAEKVEAPAGPPLPAGFDEDVGSQPLAAGSQANGTSGNDTETAIEPEQLKEPIKADPHAIDAEAVEDAWCFGSDAFLIPPPDCFHYTEGKEGVRFDGERIAAYLLEETVFPWKGYCSAGK